MTKPSTKAFLLKRRELLKAALIGTAGYGLYDFLAKRGIAGLGEFLTHATRRPGLHSHDAAEILADALRFGPSLLFVSEAMAQDAKAPAVFRMFYAISHDSRNELHLVDHGNQYNPFATLNYGAMQAALAGKTKKAPQPHDIMNEWAYGILSTGTADGTNAFPGVAAKPALTPDELARITIISAVGLGGTEGVHRRGAIPAVGTLEYAMMTAFKNYSPIGSVSLNTPVIDSAGGVNSPGTTVSKFLDALDVPAVYMSRAADDNPVRMLDALTGDKQVKVVRDQMLDAHRLLTEQLENIKKYGPLSKAAFTTYGARSMEGLASMMMFADLFERGLATVGSAGLPSFDFHATDALRAPNGAQGNMLTETAQALAGTFHIARAAFASGKDAIVHFTTCSNRNETWVNDDGHVSTLTFIIKGSETSPFAKLPAQLQLLPDNVGQVYAEGPGGGVAKFSGEAADALQMTGAATVGRLEAGIVRAVGKIIGETPEAPLENPPAKIL